MIKKRNIRTLPKDQTMTTGDQVLIVDKETNLAKLVNQEEFRGEKGLDITNIQKTAETVDAITLTITYSDGNTKDFDVPRGPQGTTGDTPSITATVNIGANGTPATVNTTGTAKNPVLNFTLPKPKDGSDGQSQYIHIAYATDNTGTGASYTATSNHKYIAMQVTNSNTQPTLSTFNNWMKWLGEDGNGSGDMIANNNLSDLDNTAIARNNLNVYSKVETDTKLDNKVDTEMGKGLSANDFTNELLTKLNGLDASKYAKLEGGNTLSGNQIINGNVGIGTTSPTAKLDVRGGSLFTSGTAIFQGDTPLVFKENGENQYTGFKFLNSDGSRAGEIKKSNGGDIYFTDSTGIRLRFKDGKVGINNSNPTESLDITGDVKYCEQKTVAFYGPRSDLTRDSFAFKWRNKSGNNLFVVHGSGHIYMSNIPTSSSGLSSGEVWRNGTTLNIIP